MTDNQAAYIDLPVPRARADWGHDGAYYRYVSVERDGAVRAWDAIAQHYSVHHGLTDTEIEQALRIAGVARGAR